MKRLSVTADQTTPALIDNHRQYAVLERGGDFDLRVGI
jgi:hypothetical protein